MQLRSTAGAGKLRGGFPTLAPGLVGETNRIGSPAGPHLAAVQCGLQFAVLVRPD